MVVTNIEIVSRKIKGFTANSEKGQDSIDIAGKYIVEIQNNGVLPTTSLSFRLDKLTYGKGNDVITSQNKNIGRIQPASKKKVEFKISKEINDTPENVETVRGSCNNNSVSYASKEEVNGILLRKSFSKNGEMYVSSTSCSVAQLQQDNPEDGNGDEDEDETEDEPEMPQNPMPDPELPDPGPPSEPENGEILVRLPDRESFSTITESGQEISQQIIVENTSTERVAPTFAHVILDGDEIVDTCGEGRYELAAEQVGTITLSGTVDVQPDDYDIGITVNGDIKLRKSEVNREDNEEEEENGGVEQPGIQGPNVLRVGEEGTYTWDDFPPQTAAFRYRLLSEGQNEDAPEGSTSLEDVVTTREEIVLSLTCDISGDFLIRILASGGGQRLDQVEKVVTVVPEGTEVR